ncbi:MAG: hypothetical protein ACYTG5_15120 [Planctomycetota bacterium]
MRLGVPLRVEDLDRGLRLRGSKGARLQWSYLQAEADSPSARRWVELAILGARKRVQVMAGGVEAESDLVGAVYRRETASISSPGRRVAETRILWADGGQELGRREVFLEPWWSPGGERFAAGEARRLDGRDLLATQLRGQVVAKHWRRVGLLPPGGRLAGDLRERLLDSVKRLPTAPGERGRGDFLRGSGVVTNLEFDSCLALLRLGLFAGDREILAMAHAAARHCIDRDLDRESGLPFRHGPEHRHAPPEPGHVWVQGLLLTGCVLADRELIDAARALALSLANRLSQARHLEQGEEEPWRDRLRDQAWPLWELEVMLAFEDHPKLRAAADRLVAQILGRWDERNAVLRYGEGESRGEAYKERAWLTGGILLPALRAHQRRRGDRSLSKVIERLEERLLRLIRSGDEGMPLQYWVRDGQVFGVFRSHGVPEAVMMMEGLAPRALKSCLRRSGILEATSGLLQVDDPMLATSFSMVGRCLWIYR